MQWLKHCFALKLGGVHYFAHWAIATLPEGRLHTEIKTFLYGAYEWSFVHIMLCQIKHSFCELLTLSFYFSYGSAANSKTIKNSRLVSQKDDVHVCIMCLRAIMNYQVQDAQTWLITKTSGTYDLIAHRKEAANKTVLPVVL